MGTTAVVIAVSYAVVTVLGVVVSAVVWRSTRGRRGRVDTERLAERERMWLVIVVVLLLALLLATIFLVPYGEGSQRAPQVVRVHAFQFGWQIQPSVIKAGVDTEFDLTSSDVNHDFGVYTSGGRFLFQVQVQPGRVQRVTHTFHDPGVYRVLCLEFCGVGHHLMQAQFEVR